MIQHKVMCFLFLIYVQFNVDIVVKIVHIIVIMLRALGKIGIANCVLPSLNKDITYLLTYSSAILIITKISLEKLPIHNNLLILFHLFKLTMPTIQYIFPSRKHVRVMYTPLNPTFI